MIVAHALACRCGLQAALPRAEARGCTLKRAPLLFLLLTAAAHAAAPFSHRVHLKMGLACVTCHAAAPTSSKVEDNLLPDAKVCHTCHKQVEIPKPPETRVTKFNHAQHL